MTSRDSMVVAAVALLSVGCAVDRPSGDGDGDPTAMAIDGDGDADCEPQGDEFPEKHLGALFFYIPEG